MPAPEGAPHAAAVPWPAYRPDIDGLRAVAVSIVIAYHALPHLLPGGFIGVDVFFVISGYLITQLILSAQRQGRFSLIGFYQRRVRRIVPALLVVMTACLAVGWFVLLPGEFAWLARSLSWCAPFLANRFFARHTGYFDPGADFNVLLHLWSLAVEEQFYLLWPLLLMLAERRGLTTRVLGVVLVASLAISIWAAWHAPAVYFFLTRARAWELALGAMLAALPPYLAMMRARWRAVSAGAGLALIGAGAALFSTPNAFPGFWGLVPAGGAALLIGAGPDTWVSRVLLSNRPVRFIGRISYSLYLWHWPLFSYARIITGHTLPPHSVVLIIAAAVALSCATYWLVEVPVRYGRVGGRAVTSLLAGLLGLSALGGAVAAQWIPGRLHGPAFASWEAATKDWSEAGEAHVDPGTGFRTVTARSRRDRTALFIGDSHLQQYWPRVVRVVESHPDAARTAVFATYAACAPLPGVESTRQPRDCTGFFRYASGLANRPEVDTVVLGGFWELYFMNEYGTGRRLPVYLAHDLTRTPLRLDAADTQQVLEQFEHTVAALVASGRRVFIVLSNPTSPMFEPPAMIPARVRLTLQAPSLLVIKGGVFDAAPFESFVAPLMERLRQLAARAGAQVLDPRATLCAGMNCATVGADGLPLYIDTSHLRAAAARGRASFLDVTLLGPP